MRTEQEIEAKFDELAWMEYCDAQVGNTGSTCGVCQQMLFCWLTKREYNRHEFYTRGQQLYDAGVRYVWQNREYERIQVYD